MNRHRDDAPGIGDANHPDWSESQAIGASSWRGFGWPRPKRNAAHHKRRAMQHLSQSALKHEWFHRQTEMRNAKYQREWPQYCRTCNGWGGDDVREPHGELIYQPCLDCLANDICPRCGNTPSYDPDEMWEFGLPERPCTYCGWSIADYGIS